MFVVQLNAVCLTSVTHLHQTFTSFSHASVFTYIVCICVLFAFRCKPGLRIQFFSRWGRGKSPTLFFVQIFVNILIGFSFFQKHYSIDFYIGKNYLFYSLLFLFYWFKNDLFPKFFFAPFRESANRITRYQQEKCVPRYFNFSREVVGGLPLGRHGTTFF